MRQHPWAYQLVVAPYTTQGERLLFSAKFSAMTLLHVASLLEQVLDRSREILALASQQVGKQVGDLHDRDIGILFFSVHPFSIGWSVACLLLNNAFGQSLSDCSRAYIRFISCVAQKNRSISRLRQKKEENQRKDTETQSSGLSAALQHDLLSCCFNCT